MKILIADAKKDTKLPGILRAALRLFVAHGIDGTSIKDIAREAGVAEGSLYRHFPSKEDLAWHLFADNLKEFTSALLGKVLAEKDTRTRIRILTTECFAAYERNPPLFHFLILAEHRELPKFTRQYLHPGNLIEQIVREGKKAGEIRNTDPWILFSIIFGTIHRMCILRAWRLERRSLDELAAESSEAIWQAVKK